MAFGQQSGPPSSAKQVEEIARLLESVGYSSFREARHPFGLTQRQANGKFTQGEAVELIERIQAQLAEGDGPEPEPEPEAELARPQPQVDRRRGRTTVTSTAADRAARREADRQAEAMVAIPDEALADELVRRGWICMPPA